MIIYDGRVFMIPGIGMQVEGWYRYFYALLPMIIGFVIFFTKVTKESEVYSCEKCNDAFWENDLDNGLCPNCSGEVKNIRPEIPKY